MPIYDYKCKACEHPFSEEQSIKKYKRRRKCPSCGKYKLERVIGASTVCIRSEAKTLVHLAERNTEKMGSYELGDKRGAREGGVGHAPPRLRVVMVLFTRMALATCATAGVVWLNVKAAW